MNPNTKPLYNSNNFCKVDAKVYVCEALVFFGIVPYSKSNANYVKPYIETTTYCFSKKLKERSII